MFWWVKSFAIFWQLWMLLLRLWRWWTTLDCKMLNLPDTLKFLTGFVQQIWGCPHGGIFKVLGCRIVVSEFEIQSCYYIHFQTNTLGKVMNPPYPPPHHHHHHVVLLAWISLTLSRHFSRSFIASGWSSGPHPVFSHSCWTYVRAGRPAFARPYVEVHRSTSLRSSSLLLQQCPACMVRLTWIVFVMGGRWPYSWCFVGCCHQDLFNIARRILV